MAYCFDHIVLNFPFLEVKGMNESKRTRSQVAFDCIAYPIVFPKVHWQKWTDIDSSKVYYWSPSLCQQVQTVAEQAINQKTDLMKGKINKTQTNYICISEFSAWPLLIWLSWLPL